VNSRENVLLEFSGKRVLVTGNSGFKGAWLSTWLTELGAKVYGLSIGIPTEVSLFEDLGGSLKTETAWVDVCDTSEVQNFLEEKQPDFIFHLAAQPIVATSFGDPLETWRTNTLGTVSILEAIRRSNLVDVSVVMITSDKVYRNHEWPWGYRETDELGGDDPYSASKAGAELAIRSFVSSGYFNERNIRIASVRAGNVIGGGDWALGRVVPDAIRAWSAQQVLTLRNPSSTRPWQHVLEPLGGYLLTALALRNQTLTSGESLNFGPSDQSAKTVGDLAQSLSAALAGENPLRVDFGPRTLNESGLLRLSSDKSLQLLGWQALLNFEHTIKWTAAWYFHHNAGTEALTLCLEQIKKYQSLLDSEILEPRA